MRPINKLPFIMGEEGYYGYGRLCFMFSHRRIGVVDSYIHSSQHPLAMIIYNLYGI